MIPELDLAARARFIRSRLPVGGLFAGQDWRIAATPFSLGPALAEELETLGRVLLQFNRAVNLLYRRSVEGKQPAWVAEWLDRGKPPELIARQRAPAFRQELPRVIRPDLLLTEAGISLVELDAVPGGIGLTAWLNQTYAAAERLESPGPALSSYGSDSSLPILGGADGMLRGFASLFNGAERVHVVVSQEAATYRPEMIWLADQLGSARFSVRDEHFTQFAPGDAVYRFFELFDLPQIPNARLLFDLAAERRVRLTPPPKPIFEEKMLLALLWNRNLRGFWQQELGGAFWDRLLRHVPYTWVLDPTPLPPQGAIPELNLTDWRQLKTLSQRERELILKVSGFHPTAWGARSVAFGGDLSATEWGAAVDRALAGFPSSPYVLQRYHKPRSVSAQWFDPDQGQLKPLTGRARLCPYYFVVGDGDAARATLGGVLVTLCPADKKIIHGMREAVLAPASL